jgi:hypothetical protein
VGALTYFSTKADAGAPGGTIGGALGAFISAGVGVRFDFFGQSDSRTVAAR